MLTTVFLLAATYITAPPPPEAEAKARAALALTKEQGTQEGRQRPPKQPEQIAPPKPGDDSLPVRPSPQPSTHAPVAPCPTCAQPVMGCTGGYVSYARPTSAGCSGVTHTFYQYETYSGCSGAESGRRHGLLYRLFHRRRGCGG